MPRTTINGSWPISPDQSGEMPKHLSSVVSLFIFSYTWVSLNKSPLTGFMTRSNARFSTLPSYQWEPGVIAMPWKERASLMARNERALSSFPQISEKSYIWNRLWGCGKSSSASRRMRRTQPTWRSIWVQFWRAWIELSPLIWVI